MHQWTGSALVQIKACRLVCAKPLSELMLVYCPLWTIGIKLQWNFDQITKLFIQDNAAENVVCEMVAILSRGRWVLTIMIPVSEIEFEWAHNFTYFTYAWRRRNARGSSLFIGSDNDLLPVGHVIKCQHVQLRVFNHSADLFLSVSSIYIYIYIWMYICTIKLFLVIPSYVCIYIYIW